MTLDELVRSYLLEIGDANLNRYARLYQIAVSGLTDLHLDTSGIPTTALIPVTSSDAANLPNDFISLIRLAVLDSNGVLKALGMSENIGLPRSFDNCGNDAIVGSATLTSSGVSLEGLADNYRNGECVGRMFGIGGGGNIYGNYRIDQERGTINFFNLLTNTSSVILEYLSDLSLVNGDYKVHPFIIEALKAWMYWKDIQRNSAKGIGEKQLAQRQYELEERQAKRRFNNHDIQTWLQAFRFGNKMSVKF